MNIFAQNVYIAPDTTSTTQATNSGLASVLILVYVALLIIMLVSLIKIFTKADRKWWEAIIPIYNSYVLLKIVGRPGWWLLLFFIPFVNIIIAIIVIFDLAKAFGKGAGTALGLFFLSFIFFPLMAFSESYKYKSVGNISGNTPSKPTESSNPSVATSNPEGLTGQAVTNIPAAGAAVGVGVGAAQDNEPITNAPLDQQPAGNPSSAIGSPPSSPENEIKSESVNNDVTPVESVTPPTTTEPDSIPPSPEPPVEAPQPTSPTPPIDEPVPAPPSTDDQQNNL